MNSSMYEKEDITLIYSKTVFLLYCIISFISLTLDINQLFVRYPLVYLSILIFIFLGIKDNEFKNIPSYLKRIFIIYWIYSIFIISYGLILSESYWDYKNVFMSYVPYVFVSFGIFVGLNIEKYLTLLKFIIRRIFPITFIIGIIAYIFFYQSFYYLDFDHVLTRLTIPIFLFVLAVPFLRLNYKIFIILFSIFHIMIDLEWRTNILRLGLCWSFVLIYLICSFKNQIPKFIALLLIITPFFLLYSGISGKFDIFQFISEGPEDNKYNLRANTRSFLYEEVFQSFEKKDTNLLIGGGASNGYNTVFFSDFNISQNIKQERYRSEVNILNTLNQSGLIGLILDMLILLMPALLAINRSNNDFTKLLGLYLVLSWVLFFLEMPQALNLNYFLNYIIIGICMNNSFRKFDNLQINFLFKSI
jgi:hypothetical protein